MLSQTHEIQEYLSKNGIALASLAEEFSSLKKVELIWRQSTDFSEKVDQLKTKPQNDVILEDFIDLLKQSKEIELQIWKYGNELNWMGKFTKEKEEELKSLTETRIKQTLQHIERDWEKLGEIDSKNLEVASKRFFFLLYQSML